MGTYLNSKKARKNYEEIVNSAYFVDKTPLLEELIPILGQENAAGERVGQSHKYVCITRPRRFGKTVMANMIAAYFGKGTDSSGLSRMQRPRKKTRSGMRSAISLSLKRNGSSLCWMSGILFFTGTL